MLQLLVHGDVLDGLIDLHEEAVVGQDTALMPCAENVLIVVCELFTADGADDVSRSRFGLLDRERTFLSRCKLPGLLLQIFKVLFIQ